MYNDIKAFHVKYELPMAKQPVLLSTEMMEFRLKFMIEELDEIIEGWLGDDLHEIADGLVDLVYVALGTAALMGLPFEELWNEVHTANMAKVRALRAEDSKRGSTYDVVKPSGWVAPDFTKYLGEKK